MNNIYIINEVLWDYTEGMAVICAPSLERCREIFEADMMLFNFNSRAMEEYDSAIENKAYKVIEGVNHDEGIVSYVYGGG